MKKKVCTSIDSLSRSFEKEKTKKKLNELTKKVEKEEKKSGFVYTTIELRALNFVDDKKRSSKPSEMK